MTKALSQHLEAIKEAKKGIFVPYIMAGDHEKGLAGLFETIDMMAKAGASAIEIGVPFSDPVADGPVIEAAGLRSLDKGTSLKAIIVTLQEKEVATPLILMTYFNPVYQYGVEQLIQDLHSTSVKGLIIPDLPYEHEDLVKPYLQGTAISLISLVSLTTGLERQKELVKKAQGFVYAVAVNGVTGKSDQYREHLDGHLRNLREMSPVPVLTGFGVSSKKDIIRFNQVSDGVIVGSKIVRALYEKKEDEVTELISFGSHYQK